LKKSKLIKQKTTGVTKPVVKKKKPVPSTKVEEKKDVKKKEKKMKSL